MPESLRDLIRGDKANLGNLERIALDWTRIAVQINRVNLLDLDSVDQIHAPAGSPLAIPVDRYLVYARPVTRS